MKLVDVAEKVFAHYGDSGEVNSPPVGRPYEYSWYWAFDEDTGILYQMYRNDTREGGSDYGKMPAQMVSNFI